LHSVRQWSDLELERYEGKCMDTGYVLITLNDYNIGGVGHEIRFVGNKGVA